MSLSNMLLKPPSPKKAAATSRHLNEIFFRKHEFTDPPKNPKIVVDASYTIAAKESAGQNSSISIVKLVGPSRFHTTQCIMDDIISRVGNKFLPPCLQLDNCLHHANQRCNPEACLKLLFASTNPRMYILATQINAHIADDVKALPVITLEKSEAVYKEPTPSQMDYAKNTHRAVILRNKQADQKYMFNYIAKKKKKQGSS